MSNRKSIASKVVSSVSPTSASTRKSRRGKTTRNIVREGTRAARTATKNVDLASYVGPGAAVLASGAVAAMAYMFKEQIGEIVVEALAATAKRSAKAMVATSKAIDTAQHTATDVAGKISDSIPSVSLDAILRTAGLQQRRSTFSTIMGPAIGVACGLAAGSALTMFGPRLFELLRDSLPADAAAATPEPAAAPAPTPSTIIENNRVRANGDLRGATS